MKNKQLNFLKYVTVLSAFLLCLEHLANPATIRLVDPSQTADHFSASRFVGLVHVTVTKVTKSKCNI